MSRRDLSKSALQAHYEDIESSVPLSDDPDYASLVIPNGNGDEPIHRWFHLKEAYSHKLLLRVLKDVGLPLRRGVQILDPYAGVGTTAVSTASAAVDGDLANPAIYGIESNAFLHLVASAKLQAMQSPPRRFREFAEGIVSHALNNRATSLPIPTLSTFHRGEYFEPNDVAQLVRLRMAIEDAEQRGASEVEAALARVCLGAIVESVSNLRRDGRTLRYTDKHTRRSTMSAYREKARQVQQDLPPNRVDVRGRIMLGDGRVLEGIDGRSRAFDLVLFSPPYPNNIDYTEVYKLENWLLGYITDRQSFTEQRLRTVYSHPSILRSTPLPSDSLSAEENSLVAEVVAPLVEAVPSDRYTEGRRRMLSGYAVDMYLTLRSATTHLAADGRIVYVVGNSVHGRGEGQLVIAADLMIGQLARIAGLEIERFIVARRLRRRNAASPHLRESVVFLKMAQNRQLSGRR